MAEQQFSDDQILSALSQIQGWAYALPQAKGIVQKYKEAKQFLEGLPRAVQEMETKKTDLERRLKEIEPAFREKNANLEAEYKEKEQALRKDLADQEAHLAEGVKRLRNEALDLQSEIAVLNGQKADQLKEWNTKIQTEKDKFNQVVNDFRAWRVAHGLE